MCLQFYSYVGTDVAAVSYLLTALSQIGSKCRVRCHMLAYSAAHVGLLLAIAEPLLAMLLLLTC